MSEAYNKNDYDWIKELLLYPETLKKHLNFIEDTSQIKVPDDQIEKVIFQDKAKKAIRKIAQNRGHMLMVGRPGTGKSLLSNMFKNVIDKSMGEYIRPKESIAAYPGKDGNHVRFAYADPEKLDSYIASVREEIEIARHSVEKFSLKEQIQTVRKAKKFLVLAAGISFLTGLFLRARYMY